jgi:glycosyltransferase involved in cell wall biosynthesis
MKMKKIVFYCKDSLSNIDRFEYYSLDIKALQNLGFEVIICTRYRDIPKDFDAIYIYWWTYALYPILLAKIRNKKAYVSGVFNFRFPEWQAGIDYYERPFLQRFLMKWAMKLADANLITSLSDYENCTDSFNLKNSYYTPCCIGDEYFEVNGEANSNSLMNIAWSSISSLKRKGVFDIVSALKIVKDKGHDFSLYLMGARGDGENMLLELIVQKGLEDSIVCIGEVSKEDKMKMLATSSIYVQPSNYEGFGLASAEAMAVGLRVIACDVGDVKNTLGDYAHYVENGNIEELADKLSELLTTSNDNSETLKARNFLKDKYSFQAKLDTLSKIIDIP